MKRYLENVARKAQIAIVMYHIYANWQAGRAFRRGNDLCISGSTHQGLSTRESVNYINEVFGDYLKYSGLSAGSIAGKRVLEIGPGDNLGVALTFIAAGAARVVSLDKFYSNRDLAQQRQIYFALRAQLSGVQLQRYDEAITINDKIELNPNRLLYVHGTGIEDADQVLRGESFDLIVSRAVVEHLYDTDAAFAMMDRFLVPGGHIIHEIDFRDHGMFTNGGHHPLTFLTISDPVYSLMTKHSGSPNRRTAGYYQQKMRELGYSYKILATHVVGVAERIEPYVDIARVGAQYGRAAASAIEAIRPRLLPRYRAMPDEELLVSGIFLVGQKAQGGGAG